MEVDQFFRAGVGAVIINDAGLVLVAERSDVASAWQIPQGGIEPGEDPVEAIRREVEEELGVDWGHIDMVAELDDWLAYELPKDAWSSKTGRGQVHRWFLLRVVGDPEVKPDTVEFARFRWVPMSQLVEVAWAARRPVYQRLAEEWSKHLAG